MLLIAVLVQSAAPEIPQPRKPQRVGSYNVPPSADALITPLRVEFQAYRDAIMADSQMKPEEKALRIRGRYEMMRAEVLSQRTVVYQRYYYWARAQNNVSKSSKDMSGDTKKSAGKCHRPPDRDLRTNRAWGSFYRVSGTNVGWSDVDRFTNGHWRNLNENTTPNSRFICSPNLRRSGGGKQLVRVFGYFRYPDPVVARKARQDADYVMTRVV